MAALKVGWGSAGVSLCGDTKAWRWLRTGAASENRRPFGVAHATGHWQSSRDDVFMEAALGELVGVLLGRKPRELKGEAVVPILAPEAAVLLR